MAPDPAGGSVTDLKCGGLVFFSHDDGASQRDTWMCLLCNQLFSSGAALKKHSRTHTSPVNELITMSVRAEYVGHDPLKDGECLVKIPLGDFGNVFWERSYQKQRRESAGTRRGKKLKNNVPPRSTIFEPNQYTAQVETPQPASNDGDIVVMVSTTEDIDGTVLRLEPLSDVHKEEKVEDPEQDVAFLPAMNQDFEMPGIVNIPDAQLSPVNMRAFNNLGLSVPRNESPTTDPETIANYIPKVEAIDDDIDGGHEDFGPAEVEEKICVQVPEVSELLQVPEVSELLQVPEVSELLQVPEVSESRARKSSRLAKKQPQSWGKRLKQPQETSESSTTTLKEQDPKPKKEQDPKPKKDLDPKQKSTTCRSLEMEEENDEGPMKVKLTPRRIKTIKNIRTVDIEHDNEKIQIKEITLEEKTISEENGNTESAEQSIADPVVTDKDPRVIGQVTLKEAKVVCERLVIPDVAGGVDAAGYHVMEIPPDNVVVEMNDEEELGRPRKRIKTEEDSDVENDPGSDRDPDFDPDKAADSDSESDRDANMDQDDIAKPMEVITVYAPGLTVNAQNNKLKAALDKGNPDVITVTSADNDELVSVISAEDIFEPADNPEPVNIVPDDIAQLMAAVSEKDPTIAPQKNPKTVMIGPEVDPELGEGTPGPETTAATDGATGTATNTSLEGTPTTSAAKPPALKRRRWGRPPKNIPKPEPIDNPPGSVDDLLERVNQEPDLRGSKATRKYWVRRSKEDIKSGLKVTFECARCQWQTPNHYNYHRHLFSHQMTEYGDPKADTECDICGKVLRASGGRCGYGHVKEACYICNDGVPMAKAQLTKHMVDKHPEVTSLPFSGRSLQSCEEAGCTYRTSKPRYMERHRAKHARGEIRVKGGKRRKRDREDKKDIVNLTTLLCHQCPYKTNRTDLMEQHLKRHNPEEAEEFHCDICDFVTLSAQGLKTHIRNHQTDVSCPLCKETSHYNISGYQKHLRDRHQLKEPIFCETCGLVFTDRDQLSRHMTDAHSRTPRVPYYVCFECGESSTNKEELQMHQWSHSAESEEAALAAAGLGEGMSVVDETGASIVDTTANTSPDNTLDTSLDAKPGKKKDTTRRLRKNLKALRDSTFVKKYPCTHCPEKYDDMPDLNRHLGETHEVKDFRFQCKVCGRFTTSQGDLRRHTKEHTLATEIFVCDVCGFEARRKWNLMRHKEKTHEYTSYSCSHCDYTTRSVLRIAEHFRKVHLIEPPDSIQHLVDAQDSIDQGASLKKIVKPKRRSYSANMMRTKYRDNKKMCNECGKMVPYGMYETHMNHHRGHKPFRCHYESCGFSAGIASVVADHIRRVHLHLTPQRFQCAYCSFQHNKRKQLEAHILQKHATDNMAASTESLAAVRGITAPETQGAATATVEETLTYVITPTGETEQALIQPEEHTIIQSGEHALIQSGEHALIQSGEHTIIQSVEHALIQEGEQIVIQPGEHSVLEGEHTVIQEGEHLVYDTGEQAVLQEELVVGEEFVTTTSDQGIAYTTEQEVMDPGQYMLMCKEQNLG